MQLRLIVLNGAQAGRQCQFDSQWIGQWLLLGRSRESALPLTDAPMVSVRHAVLRVEDDGFYLIDQQSTNGTYVNTQLVQRVKLRHDDLIQLGTGGPQLSVELETPAPINYDTNVDALVPPPPPPPPPPSQSIPPMRYDTNVDALRNASPPKPVSV
ncbi:MAG: FHA domain-containing protein, partial [Acidobacteria bacterium]|nr:FHA domain-containing protein [Acidobacteriota bacterium]